MTNIDHKDALRGLYQKFNVFRNDGRDEQGEKHEGCKYFVLDIDHDPHALPALAAYAKSCREDFPALAYDIAGIRLKRLGDDIVEATRLAELREHGEDESE